MPQIDNVDFSFIKQAMQRRAMGGEGTPALNQMGTPVNPTQSGATPVPNTPPSTPQPPSATPKFRSPFAGPKQGTAQGVNFDEETKQVSKALISRLLKVL